MNNKFLGMLGLAKFVEAGSKAELGKFTGADNRAVVSVNDDNFAKAILDRLND